MTTRNTSFVCFTFFGFLWDKNSVVLDRSKAVLSNRGCAVVISHALINMLEMSKKCVFWQKAPEVNVDVCNKLFTHVADSHAPIRKSRIKGIRSPRMNARLSEAMHKRDHYHRKALKSKPAIIGHAIRN